jgi:LuxR family transcriptional regulator, maltose regulon positive regulatory protein
MRLERGSGAPEELVRERTASAGESLSGGLVPPPASQARPPRTPWGVERRQLLRRLSRAVNEVPLTLIGAPAGSGKTVLAADWARRRAEAGRTVAWLTATDRDNHPGVFWLHLQLALATVGVVDPRSFRRPLVPGAADVDALAAQVLRLEAPVVLVVDAAERLSSDVVHERVERLVDTAADRLRLVVTTRADPPLPLHRYRVEDRVAEIRADDLALGREEVGEVIARHGLTGTRDLTDEVWRRTEGWAAAVRLAALQLVSLGPDAELDGFADSYIRAEIVAGLARRDHDLLTATSVVDELPRGLAPALTDRPAADDLLRRLRSGNAFVQLVPGRSDAHRVHPLVRAVLRAELESERAADLHRRAAAWFETQGELEPAVRHVTEAGEWAAAAAQVVGGRGLAEMVVGTPTGAALAGDLAAIPEDGSPDGNVVRAAIALHDGDLDAASAALGRAGTGGVGQKAGNPRRDAAASLVRAAWHRAAGRRVETLEAALRARALLGGLEDTDAFTAAAAATAEGAAQLRVGDLAAACAALGEATATTGTADGALRLRCLAELSLAEACAGRLTRALELVGAAEHAAADLAVPRPERPVAIDLARAWVALEQQDLDVAHRSLDRVARSRTDRDDPTFRTIAELLRARYRRDHGDLPGARRLLGRAGAECEPVPWLRQHLVAESHDLGGPPDLADEAPSRRVHDLLEHADRRCQDGEVHEARQAISRALQLGRAEHLRRPFVHASLRVRSIIRNDARVQARADWLLLERLDDADDGPVTPEPLVLEGLTGREHEVLRHLAAFRTTEEIAEEMFISVNTVRTHVRRVLEKLAVSRRHEAVRRGQELGLV